MRICVLATLGSCGSGEDGDSRIGADGRAPDAGGLDGGTESTDGGVRSNAFTIVVLPDTQYLVHVPAWRPMFEAQAKWIMSKRAELEIGFVLHLGDIVEATHNTDEWKFASMVLHALDDVVPYALAVGNHDFLWPRDSRIMNMVFPVERFMRHPWWKGTFEPGKIDNSYQIIPAGGKSWLVVTLEFGPRNETLDWANDVLAKNREIPAIIVTHAYMYNYGNRYNHAAFNQCFTADPSSRGETYALYGTRMPGSSAGKSRVFRVTSRQPWFCAVAQMTASGSRIRRLRRRSTARVATSRVSSAMRNWTRNRFSTAVSSSSRAPTSTSIHVTMLTRGSV